MRVAREAINWMRLAWDNPLWKKCAGKYGLKPKDCLAVNTIVDNIQKAIGIHSKDDTTLLGRPLPFNYYDTCLIVVNETAHQRVIGIMGCIFNNILQLIPSWHREERLQFFANTDKSRGFSSLMNISSDLKGKSPKCSRKAVRIWAACMQLLCDGEIYGIHPEVLDFLRAQMMLLGRWFSPSFSLYEHFKCRKWWLDWEVKLDTWRKRTWNSKYSNQQLKRVASSLWRTYNYKNVLLGWDIHAYTWGSPKALFGLGYESFHKVQFLFGLLMFIYYYLKPYSKTKKAKGYMNFFNYKRPEDVFIHQAQRARTDSFHELCKLGLCHRTINRALYGGNWVTNVTPILNNDSPFPSSIQDNIFTPRAQDS